MSQGNSTSPRTSVFEQIEDALRSTASGRAFLAECEQRGRSRETAMLLDAVARLENRTASSGNGAEEDELRSLLGQIESAIRDAKSALAGTLAVSRERRQASEPPTVAAFGRETTHAIVEAAEAIQDTAWRLREAGFDGALCDRIEAQTSTIYSACRRQERMLDGLSTIERTIGRADAFLTELKRALVPTDIPPLHPPVGARGSTLVSGDLEFSPVTEADETACPSLP